MSKRNKTTHSDTGHDWLTLLGIRDPGTEEWARVRAEQINLVQNFALLRLAVSIMAGCVIVATLGPTASPPVLLGWFVGVVVVSSLLAWPHIRSNRSYAVMATRMELHRETLSLVAAATVWIVWTLVRTAKLALMQLPARRSKHEEAF